MGQQFALFIIRWILNAIALWISFRVLGGFGVEITASNTVMTFALAGFVLSLVNVVLKPVLIILSLPAILLTLGLFTFILNGFMVYLTSKIAPGIHMTFGAAILAGIIVSLVNYILTGILQLRRGQEKA